MPTDVETGGKWKKVIFIILLMVFVIGVLITVIVGVKGLEGFFKWLIGIVLVLSILFGLLYLAYTIFIKKNFKDIPATYKKKLIHTAKMMKNEMLGDLYLSGDSKHNRIKLGKYAYMRLTLPKQTVEVQKQDSDDPFRPVEDKETEFTESVPVDCFVILKTGFFAKLFGDPIFVFVRPEDHNHTSIFNDVTIYGFNLVPLDSQFYTIDKRNLDVDIIKGVATSYIRETVYEIFKDLDRLVKQAMNLDQQFQKEKQKGLEFEIPQMPQIGQK